jgi:hypothetical protein
LLKNYSKDEPNQEEKDEKVLLLPCETILFRMVKPEPCETAAKPENAVQISLT